MTQTVQLREALPAEMQILLKDYPRAAWPENPHFAQSIQNWMGAHKMFRQLSDITLKDTEAFLDRSMAPETYAKHISYYGDLLVRNLHGHHTWEDRKFFPELSKADNRFDGGLDTLELDHEVLDKTLNGFTGSANRVLKLMALDEKQAFEEAGNLRDYSQQIDALLKRHLQDEEDLVVPIILHHKLRG